MNRIGEFDLNVTDSYGTVAYISVTSWSTPALEGLEKLHRITPQLRSLEEVRTYVELFKTDLEALLVQASQHFGPKEPTPNNCFTCRAVDAHIVMVREGAPSTSC
jgi:hypothetical protein